MTIDATAPWLTRTAYHAASRKLTLTFNAATDDRDELVTKADLAVHRAGSPALSPPVI